VGKSVSGEMLAAIRHAGQRETVIETLCEHRHHARIAMERAIANHLRLTVVQIEHRRKTHVDTARPQFGGENVAHRRGDLGGMKNVRVPQRAELAHRRQHGEAIGAETLHAAAFVIDGDQQIVAYGADRIGQRNQLRAVLVVTSEQDHAAGHRMREAALVVVGQRFADHVEHHRAGIGFHRFRKKRE
jgi:hypothetical protein